MHSSKAEVTALLAAMARNDVSPARESDYPLDLHPWKEDEDNLHTFGGSDELDHHSLGLQITRKVEEESSDPSRGGMMSFSKKMKRWKKRSMVVWPILSSHPNQG